MRPSTQRAVRAGLVAAATCGLLIVGHGSADARCSKLKEITLSNGKTKKVPRIGKPERSLGGKVLTSGKRFPTSARSEGAYISKVRKRRKDKFWEDKANKEWKIYFMAFFRRPLDDMEVSIKLWDMSSGSKQLTSAFEQFLERCSTSYASKMIIKREKFGVNKQILITVEDSIGTVLARGKFRILGEAERFKGKVDFSEDEKPAEVAEADNDDADDTPDEPEEEIKDPLDIDEDEAMNSPDLDAREGLDELPGQKTKGKRGCGCGTGGGVGGGGLSLMAIVFAGLVGRRRRRTTGPT